MPAFAASCRPFGRRLRSGPMGPFLLRPTFGAHLGPERADGYRYMDENTSDDVATGDLDDYDDLGPDDGLIERALLNDSEAGRRIQAAFVDMFGRFMRDEVRPLLRDVAVGGDEPQLLVNGLAELLRSVAHKIEFPRDHPRAGFPPQLPNSAAG